MQQHEPKLVVVLAGQQANPASVVPAGSGSAWLQLSPDTMHQYRLKSQQLCLVGVCAATAAAGTPSTPGSARSAAVAAAAEGSPSPVAFRSPTLFGPAQAAVLNPSEVQLLNLADRAGLRSSSSGCDDSTAAATGNLPGHFLVPVTVWPCAKLVRGSAALSPSAWDSLAQPAARSHLAIFELQNQQTAGADSAARSVQLQLCTDTEGLPLTPRDINPSPAEGSTASSISGSTPGRPGSAAAAGYSTPGKSSKTLTPRSSSKKSSKKTSNNTAQQQVENSSSRRQTDMAAQWQLRLLQSGIDWSHVTHQKLLQQLAHRQLVGRAVLPGNLIYLSVLGMQLLFQIHPQPGKTQQQQLQIGRSTTMQLLMPGEDLPTGGNTGSVDAATAAVAAAVGLEVGGTGSTVQPADLAARIAISRSAAQEAVVGSSQEAAMEAAERAVRAGHAAAAAGRGYSRLGGISSYTEALRELVLLPLQLPELFAKYKLRPPRGLLFHGPPGSGKTALARAAAVEAGATLLVVNGPDVLTEFYGESEAGLSGIFAAAAALTPSIIFIDELDAIAPSREAQGFGGTSAHTAAAGGGSGSSTAGEAAARVLTQLLTLMDGLNSSSSSGNGGGSSSTSRVVVIGATNRPSALDPALRRPGRFDRELEVGVPPPAAREDILHVRLSTVKHCLSSEQIHHLAAATHGFVGADLAALVNEAAMIALRRHVHAKQQQQQLYGGAAAKHVQQQQQQQQEQQHGLGDVAPGKQQQEQQQQQQQQSSLGLCVCWDDIAAARLLVKPSALREVAVEVPQVTWDDVGGLSAVKQRLQEAVLWPQQHADALSRLGATAPKGVLLYGPPGCSKTLLARAVAATAGLNFLSVKGGELYSKYVGESERAVAALFARARAAAPAIVFFDEIDGLVSQRGDSGSGGGIGDRVLAQLLLELDGLQPRLGVVVLAATNRPDKVDPALLRPGRFDRLLLVPPPDAAARQEILNVHTRNTPLAEDVDLADLAMRTEGFTGADISALCREAAMSALEETIGAAAVAARHFNLALLRVQPSSSPSIDTMDMYQQFARHSGLPAA